MVELFLQCAGGEGKETMFEISGAAVVAAVVDVPVVVLAEEW